MWYFYYLRSHNRRWLGSWTTTDYRVMVNFSVAHTNITSSTVRHHNKCTEALRCLFPFLAPSGAQGVTMFVRPSGLSMSSSTDIFLSHVIIIQAPRLSASSSHFPAEHFWLRRELKESQCSSDHLFTVYWVYSSNNKCFFVAENNLNGFRMFEKVLFVQWQNSKYFKIWNKVWVFPLFRNIFGGFDRKTVSSRGSSCLNT